MYKSLYVLDVGSLIIFLVTPETPHFRPGMRGGGGGGGGCTLSNNAVSPRVFDTLTYRDFFSNYTYAGRLHISG